MKHGDWFKCSLSAAPGACHSVTIDAPGFSRRVYVITLSWVSAHEMLEMRTPWQDGTHGVYCEYKLHVSRTGMSGKVLLNAPKCVRFTRSNWTG